MSPNPRLDRERNRTLVAYEKYRDLYRRAWGNPPARRLYSHVPTYFAVDDHEYDNDYQRNLASLAEMEEFAYARNMAWQYQMHDEDSRNSARPQLWQSFESAGIPFFVFDTRLERTLGNRLTTQSLISTDQLNAFDDWLQIRSADDKRNFHRFRLSYPTGDQSPVPQNQFTGRRRQLAVVSDVSKGDHRQAHATRARQAYLLAEQRPPTCPIWQK